jgi:hypothetical protein
MPKTLPLIATTAFGLEGITKRELAALGYSAEILTATTARCQGRRSDGLNQKMKYELPLPCLPRCCPWLGKPKKKRKSRGKAITQKDIQANKRG